MAYLRSAVYQVVFLAWTLGLCVTCLPTLALASRRRVQRVAEVWLDGAHLLQRLLLGITFDIRGRENLPPGAVLIAAKHQSAWDTMIFHHLVGDPAYVLKIELLSLPFIGWYMRKTGQVPVDRKAGVKALKVMVEGARRAVAEGRPVIIFPEGHRYAPGTTGDYHSGVAMLYGALAIPVIPVALNSGLFWGRNAFLRQSGRITLEILPAMPEGLDRRRFMDELQNRIETATRALEAEGLARHPHLQRCG
ncbi:MAG TPA: 1-acyl-sn-glycerol-3-phosphate acyltransferase [Rhodospirillaceae bacterium]|nr:1-acyl-sn-glycerol-3-phosphate acyltransferase [Rhodospirillaceae bacterium]